MPTAPRTFRPSTAAAPAVADLERGSARERGYTPAWDRAAADHRAEHPLCVYCARGVFGPARATPAACVDHLYPHRRYGGFWLKVYWVSSCDECHDGPKQALEGQGRAALDALAVRLGLAPLRTG
jgi:5-methylcytosine-specific restriction protein A